MFNKLNTQEHDYIGEKLSSDLTDLTDVFRKRKTKIRVIRTIR